VARDGQGLQERLQELAEAGVQVVKERCDTSSEKQVSAMLQRVRQSHGPLRVVVHAAGVLDDKLFVRQDADSMRRSFAAKADGAWHLHKHTQEDSLELFCCYSSIAALYGNFGQANYASSNTYLDELCQWRAAKGLPSISIQWPGIAEVGMAAAMGQKVKVAEDLTLSVAGVKQVVRQLAAGTAPVSPVLVVTTAGLLVPHQRQHASMLQPLLGPCVEGYDVGGQE